MKELIIDRTKIATTTAASTIKFTTTKDTKTLNKKRVVVAIREYN